MTQSALNSRAPVSPNTVWHQGSVSRGDRPAAGATVWLTGLSGAGKSTVATACERLLIDAGRSAYVLDGDNLRHGLCGDLGFSPDDRRENLRRITEVALLFADAGHIVLVPVVSPYRRDREQVRARHHSAHLPFVEVYVSTPLEICEARDPKNLYRKARAGEIKRFTGIDDPYEPPIDPEIILGPADGSPQAQANIIARFIGVESGSPEHQPVEVAS